MLYVESRLVLEGGDMLDGSSLTHLPSLTRCYLKYNLKEPCTKSHATTIMAQSKYMQTFYLLHSATYDVQLGYIKVTYSSTCSLEQKSQTTNKTHLTTHSLLFTVEKEGAGFYLKVLKSSWHVTYWSPNKQLH